MVRKVFSVKLEESVIEKLQLEKTREGSDWNSFFDKGLSVISKVEKQSENLRRLQNIELQKLRRANEKEENVKKMWDSIDQEIVKSRFYDDFFNWGGDVLDVAKSVAKDIWVDTKFRELEKMCRRR